MGQSASFQEKLGPDSDSDPDPDPDSDPDPDPEESEVQRSNILQHDSSSSPSKLEDSFSKIDFKKILAENGQDSDSSESSASSLNSSRPQVFEENEKLESEEVEEKSSSKSNASNSPPSASSSSSPFLYPTDPVNTTVSDPFQLEKESRDSPPSYEEWALMDKRYDEMTVFFEKLIVNGPGKNRSQSQGKFGYQLRELWKSSQPSPLDSHLRWSLHSRIETMILRTFEDSNLKVAVIGSSSTETYTFSSSLDLVLLKQVTAKVDDSLFKQEWDKVEAVFKLFKEKRDQFRDVTLSKENKGKIISFTDLTTSINVKLRINDSRSLASSEFIQSFISQKPSLLKPLLHFLKSWAGARILKDFNGYMLSLMAIWSLQQSNIFLSTSEVNSLDLLLGGYIYNFFKYFSEPREIGFGSQFQQENRSNNEMGSLIKIKDPIDNSNITSSISRSTSKIFIKECQKAKVSLETAANVSRIIRSLKWEIGLPMYRRRYDQEKRKAKREKNKREWEIERNGENSGVSRIRGERRKSEGDQDQFVDQRGIASILPSIPTGPKALDPKSPSFQPGNFQKGTTQPRFLTQSQHQVQHQHQSHSHSSSQFHSHTHSRVSGSSVSIGASGQITPTQPRSFIHRERRREIESRMTSSERTRARKERRERAKERKS